MSTKQIWDKQLLLLKNQKNIESTSRGQAVGIPVIARLFVHALSVCVMSPDQTKNDKDLK